MKKSCCTTLLMLLGIVIGFVAKAQPWLITGHIAASTGTRLNGASVALVDSAHVTIKTVTTDSSGYFELQYSMPGPYRLLVSHADFQHFNSDTFYTGHKDFGNIQLLATHAALDNVTVRSKQDLIEVDANSITYNVSKSISAQGTNALEALKKAPGITIENESLISLNGKRGVLILLDGKQTYMSGTELIDMLKAMPSSGILSIEIMNSPSAKYDASGAAGIINIKTIKQKGKGWNGTLTTGFAYGVFVKQNEDLSFSYRKNNYTVYGSYNHFIGYNQYLYGSYRIQQNKQYTSDTYDTDKRTKIGSRLGVDYTLGKNQTFGILMTGNFILGGGLTKTTTDRAQPNAADFEQRLYAENDYYYQQTKRYNVNLNYKYEQKNGRIVNVDVDYGDFKKGNANLQSNVYTDNQNVLLSKNLYRSLNDIDIDLRAIKFDYVTPAWKGSLEMGAKYSTVTSNNNAQFFHVLTHKDSLDQRRSNRFGFRERIASGYVNYKKNIGKWSLQAGLRLEHSASVGNLLAYNNSTSGTEHTARNRTNLFPSGSVAFRPKQNHVYSVAYSRRIDRPAYQDLNPFVYLLDELSFWQGNPFLQPQLTHKLALQYVYKSSTIIGLNFASTSGYSTRITDTIEAVKLIMIPRNLGVQRNISLTLTQNLSPYKWWDITFNGMVFHVRNKIAFDAYRNMDLEQLAGKFNIQQRFSLPFAIKAELSGTYNTKKLAGANEFGRPTSIVDIGLQRNFFSNKATFRLSVTDIFKGSFSRSVQRFDGFYLAYYGYYETRQLRLNFTYKFLDNSDKSPRTRSAGLENENSRLK